MGTWVIEDEKVGQFAEENTTLLKIPAGFDYGKTLRQDIYNLLNGNTGKKMTPYIELQAWRKIGKKMDTWIELAYKWNRTLSIEHQRTVTMKSDRANQRWTEQEDEVLIELLCDDDMTLLDVSNTLGRSISAIQARCSKLVGIKRVTQEIQGKFQGKLNGMVVDGTIDGLLTRE